MDVMKMNEDATFYKFEADYWEFMVDKGYGKEATIAALDRGEFWDWLEDFVPEDDWVYL